MAVDNISSSADTMVADVYVRPVGIEEDERTEIGFSEFSVFPTVSSSVFNITFSVVGTSSPVIVSIYDVTGRLIKQYQSPANAALSWHGKDQMGRKVTPGIYFIKINDGNNSLKKIILID